MKFDEDRLKAIISDEINQAENYAMGELTPSREKAINYYNGNVTDVPAMEGRSKYISRDVSNVIGWILPDIMRVFTASDRIVDCLPETEEDEESSEQAADYLNFCFWRDNPGYQIMWDATWDALVNKDGIVKQFWDIREECKYSTYTGLDEYQIAVIAADEGVEIVEQSEPYSEMVPLEEMEPQEQAPQEPMGDPNMLPPAEVIPAPDTPDVPEMPLYETMEASTEQPMETEQESIVQMAPVTLWDIKIKRTTKKGKLVYQVVAPENFGTDANAIDLVENWRFQYEKCANVTRSDLIKMGFARERVDAIPAFNNHETTPEDLARRNLVSGQYDNPETSMERVDLYECYIKLDIDDDGMAEIVKVMYAGDAGGAEILDWEEWDDETPFDKIPCNPIPHRFSSDSLADEMMDIQKFKTVIGRQMFDNMYQSNTPQPIVLEKSVLNMDAVVNRGIGVPIIVKDINAIRYDVTPFIGDKALMAMQYLDADMEMRTGVSRSSTSLDPETLQNQTATAAQIGKDSSHSQVELIARNQAELGWKRVFQKSLRLIAKNQDRPRTIRLRDKWVDMDPRQWNTGMDIVVNVGLGTGSRDRDMAMLNNILQSQILITDRFANAGFAEKAIDMIPKINKTLIKIAEASGIKSPEGYYPEASEETIAAMKKQMADQAGQPDPAMQAAQAKMQADMQIQQMKMQMQAQQDQVQAAQKAEEAKANAALEIQKMNMEFQLKQQQLDAEILLKREQNAAEIQLKREQMAAELQMQREAMMMGIRAPQVAGGGFSISNAHLGGDAG